MTLSFDERLNQILPRLTSRDFLDSKGLGNEIGFWIFDYPPERELEMRSFLSGTVLPALTKQVPALRADTIDLLQLVTGLLEERNLLDKAMDMQLSKGELWGRTEMMKEAVFAISKLIEKEWGEPIDIVAVCNAAQSDRKDSLLSKARLLLNAGFNDVLLGPSPAMSERFELLMLPGVHVAAMYQWKSPASEFLSVPIGFLSEQKNKLNKSLIFLRKVCASKLYRAFWGNGDDGDGNRLMLNDVSASEFLYLDAFSEVEG